MNSPEENPTDDELADLMDEEASDSSITGNEEGAVEAGIPPSVNLDDPELEVEEEAFSIDDFESNLSPGEEESPTEEQTSPVSDGGGEEAVSMPEVSKTTLQFQVRRKRQTDWEGWLNLERLWQTFPGNWKSIAWHFCTSRSKIAARHCPLSSK